MNEKAKDYLQQAVNLMAGQSYEKAKEYCQKALAEEPRYAEAYSVLGDACANLEQYPEALEAFQKVVILEPDNGAVYFDIGNIYILMDDICKCIENYNKAEEKGFRHYEMYRNLAGIYKTMDEPEAALRNYNKALKEQPLKMNIRLEKAGYLILLGRYQAALDVLDEAWRLVPDLFEVYAMKVQILSMMKQYDKALAVIEDATERFPDDAGLALVKMRVLTDMGRYSQVRTELEKIKEKPEYIHVKRNVLLQQSQVAALEKRMQEAVECLEEILETEEGFDEEVRYLLMNIYNSRADDEKAMEMAESLAERQEKSIYAVSGMYTIPLLWKRAGREEEAQTEFRRLARYFRKLTVENPRFHEVYLYRILCHKELGEYDKALELADYVEALDEKRGTAYMMKYDIYKTMGDKEKAEEIIRKAKENGIRIKV